MSPTLSRGALLAVFTAALLAHAVGTASANHLSVNERKFDAKWTALRFIAGANTITCPVTLEGSFHYSTINKLENALIGHVSRASVNNASCSGGNATVLHEALPWHLQYFGFAGTLPNITEVRLKLLGAAFRIQPEGNVACLAVTSAEHPSIGIVVVNGSHEATSLVAEVGAEIPLRGGFGLCNFAGGGHFEGGTVTLARLGSTTRISIVLI